MKTGLWQEKREAGVALWPPCREACPAHTDCRGYVALIALGRYDEALDLIRERAPLAASLGRICHHPCEDKCRRAPVDGAVSIRSLKRYAADMGSGTEAARAVAKPTGKRVAVIGGGPAGLTAAADLAKRGHAVTIFERKLFAGGALLTGVPAYRLPKDVLAKDVEYVASLGVDILCGEAIDGEKARALAEEFDAVVVATGLPVSRGLPLPGADAEGVHLALPLLEAANIADPLPVNGRVVVIGGGNVAIDVARTALRTGAESVSLYCLEGPTLSDMPAFSWEIDEAGEEGVDFNPSWGPVEIVEENGRVSGVRFKHCTRVFDDQGRFNPQFDESNLIQVRADHVVFAIGQVGDVAFLEGIVELDGGRIKVDRSNLSTSNPKVFVAGEVMTGPGSAIAAIASGHEAAESVDAFLAGRARRESAQPPVVSELPRPLIEKIAGRPRAESEMLPADVRVGGFMEVEATFPEEAAVKEALRCLSCGNGAVADEEACAGCLMCVRICPFEAPSVRRTAAMDPDFCQACGLCATECPANAVEIGAGDIRIWSDALKGSEMTVFACREAILLPERSSTTERQVVGVPCAARLDGRAVLRAFEAGSESVLLIGCRADECRYGSFSKLESRIERLRGLLNDIGMNGRRLGLSTEPDIDLAVENFKAEAAAEAVIEGEKQ